MKSYPTITTLKALVKSYDSLKSDTEIANMLNISIDDVLSVKKQALRNFDKEKNDVLESKF